MVFLPLYFFHFVLFVIFWLPLLLYNYYVVYQRELKASEVAEAKQGIRMFLFSSNYLLKT